MWRTIWILASLAILTKGGWWNSVQYSFEELQKTEAHLTKILDTYLFQQEARLKLLKQKVEFYKKENSIASGDESNYVSDPINAYLLVKRLMIDWKSIENIVKDDIEQDAINNMTNLRQYMKFPTDEHLNEVATALISIQDKNALDTASVANGELDGFQYKTQMSSSDCYELGLISYNKDDFYHSKIWMEEALTRHEREINHTDTIKSDILEYLAYATYKEGDLESALILTSELLDILPDHARALQNIDYYRNAIGQKTISIKRDWYSVLDDLDDFQETEAHLTKTLNTYLFREETRLKQLKLKLEFYKKEYSIASGNVSNYLSNPINAYLLIKRLMIDWKNIENLMKDDIEQDSIKNMTNIRQNKEFPTDEHLNGTATALLLLQDTYILDTATVAKGELNGVQYKTQLSSSDCFELGRISQNMDDFNQTKSWMREALIRHEREVNYTDTKKSDILEHLAHATYKEGDLESAIKMTNELLDIVPDHPRALQNIAYYYDAINKRELDKKDNQSDEGDIRNETSLYSMLCRGDISPLINITSQLKCSYLRNTPFLKLAPLKEEEAYLNPRIVLFRDSIYDSEIEIIKQMSEPRLKRAAVNNSTTGKPQLSTIRMSKSSFLGDYLHEAIERISKRVEDMTGLTTSTAESLQVVSYGIGGFYNPHYDFIPKATEDKVFNNLTEGNRIATMNSVAQGGATVFPRLRLSLWPDKGTAAFWFNLLRDGDGDRNTEHSGCPVLAGFKWISTKWLHTVGQEFRRPCTSQPGV